MPTLPTIADQAGTVGTAFSFALPDATGGNPPITYALTGTPPAGIAYIVATRTLEGTPTAAETQPLTWSAIDADSDIVSRNFDIVVAAASATTDHAVDAGPRLRGPSPSPADGHTHASNAHDHRPRGRRWQRAWAFALPEPIRHAHPGSFWG